jgi:hypothetical protein
MVFLYYLKRFAFLANTPFSVCYAILVIIVGKLITIHITKIIKYLMATRSTLMVIFILKYTLGKSETEKIMF